MTNAEQLFDALTAASDDAARLALLDATPTRVREQLHSLLVYRNVMAAPGTPSAAASEAKRAAFDLFSAQLERAPDDKTRLWVIQAAQGDPARGAAWVSEWAQRRNETTDELRRRYIHTVTGRADV
jgi:hypothetical protein